MANVERLRTVEQQISSTVDEITKDFKDRIQLILSDNQLLPSNSLYENRTEKHRLILAQVPHTLAPSTLFKDGQQMTSDAFFEEMNV